VQLYALDQTLPIAAAKAQKGRNYTCPECKAIVRLRGGASRQIHFYHPALPKTCRSHQKSLEHLQVQLQLLMHLGEDTAEIECPFPRIHRIADVAWHGPKIVFEIQCSPIPLVEVQNRIRDYATMGYATIWILHDKRFNQKSLSAAESYLRNSPCYFTNSDKTGRGIVYDQFEVIRDSRRLFKGPPLALSLSTISPLPTISLPDFPFPKILIERLKHWTWMAKGDLLDRMLKEGNLSQAAKNMIGIESRFQKKNSTLPLSTLVKKSYLFLLDRLLKLCVSKGSGQ
jgi:competence protein CoiA